jgi:hypothetical protein
MFKTVNDNYLTLIIVIIMIIYIIYFKIGFIKNNITDNRFKFFILLVIGVISLYNSTIGIFMGMSYIITYQTVINDKISKNIEETYKNQKVQYKMMNKIKPIKKVKENNEYAEQINLLINNQNVLNEQYNNLMYNNNDVNNKISEVVNKMNKIDKEKNDVENLKKKLVSDLTEQLFSDEIKNNESKNNESKNKYKIKELRESYDYNIKESMDNNTIELKDDNMRDSRINNIKETKDDEINNKLSKRNQVLYNIDEENEQDFNIDGFNNFDNFSMV